jgi:hypothetical protein
LIPFEVLAKPLGPQACSLQIPEKCGHNARDPAKPEGFARTYIVLKYQITRSHPVS